MPARKGGHEFFAKIGKTGLTNAAMRGIIYLAFAGVAHLVERDLAKVEVASSSLVARSKKKHHPSGWCFLFGMPRAGWNSLPRPARSASNPEVKAGLPRMALPFVGCREASSSLVYFAAQSAKNKEKPSFGRFQSVKKVVIASQCAPRSKCPWGTPRNDRGEVYRHAERSHPCWDGSFLYLHITPRWSGAGARRAAPWAHSARGWSRRGRPGA